ncbi:cholera toxin transcriptional activator [Vibrio crassostreae]|uniref:Cholera toxin transcriptional activator n=1 Tax=Vibrio crassostreae TaxID=246167 RepID=A0A4R3PEL7_9VIBR|nr:winged helix-turn-helix domain-containing protein [Vibrio crassostreae]MDH5953066.1 winged helix-turn-helix domain-containing protein [Vibrio crassostreae]ROS67702.1 DNA-binding winged helix-turn-helix (wHTH) protein [Vibrio crassostreae]RPF24488.1 DNA-binding winged helix-turn-helix (wHTH) protein [Vibrio crassostreae]TCL28749.1 DNA-binding winged helix-turn-helix (wHTH) protein [Vibrio crassostreae]TCN02671.1 DNA-binding winged helix-turn-helix (wHTH) protein [Vibrio crassostreae]
MSAEFIINDDIQVNLEESEIHHFKTGRTYPIGSNESELLKFFISRPNEVITRQVLIEQVWVSKGIYVEDGSLMQTISICRKALEDKSGMIIVTERGKGYRFAGQVTQDKERALRKIQAQPTQQTAQPTESSIEESPTVEKTAPTKKTNHVLALIALFVVTAGLSHYLFAYLNRNSLGEDLTGQHFISCKIETDEFTFNELFNVTLYEYKGRKVIIDNSGKSLSFPSEFKGVTCE